MSTKTVKGNRGNLKASMAVGVPNKSVERVVTVTEPTPSVTRQSDADRLVKQFGKRLHKRGWAQL